MTYSLEQFPRGLVYLVFLFFIALSARGFWRLLRRRRVDSTTYSNIGGTGLFPAIVCLVGAMTIGHRMFLRFHSVRITPDRLELLYYWPRPKVALTRLEFARLEIPQKARTSTLEIYRAGGGHAFRSVRFTRAVADDRVILAINGWKHPPKIE